MLGRVGWRIVGLVLVHRWCRVGGGRKGTEPAHGSVLFQTASPPQHAKFPLDAHEAHHYRGASCVWTESHTTEQWHSRESRSLMAGRSSRWLKKYTFPAISLLYFLSIFHVSSAVTALFALLYHTHCPITPRAIRTTDRARPRHCLDPAKCHPPPAASSRSRRSKQSRHS